jgi:SAM-dependent methyltransferase
MINAANRLDRMSFVMTGRKDWSDLVGRTVLDLGCGSEMLFPIRPGERERSNNWPPYFAYLCASNGAYTVGIDIRENPYRAAEYIHVVGDLVELVLSGSLELLPETSGIRFDMINCSAMTSFLVAPLLKQRLREIDWDAVMFANYVKLIAYGMLKDGGVLYIDEPDAGISSRVYRRQQESFACFSLQDKVPPYQP